jgi:hypothetical protein
MRKRTVHPQLGMAGHQFAQRGELVAVPDEVHAEAVAGSGQRGDRGLREHERPLHRLAAGDPQEPGVLRLCR